MPETHGTKHLYFHFHRYPDLRNLQMPVRRPHCTEKAWTQEIESPYRYGHGRVFRFWPSRRAVVIGRWGPPSGGGELHALERATQARAMHDVLADIKDWPGGEPAPTWEQDES